MPFLTRKTGVPEVNALMHGSRLSDGTAWGEDRYRPSNDGTAGLSGLALPLRQVRQKRLCGNAECMNGWTMPWRNRRRPVFESQWGCSGRCMLAIVQAAVCREQGDGGTVSPAPHLH